MRVLPRPRITTRHPNMARWLVVLLPILLHSLTYIFRLPSPHVPDRHGSRLHVSGGKHPTTSAGWCLRREVVLFAHAASSADNNSFCMYPVGQTSESSSVDTEESDFSETTFTTNAEKPTCETLPRPVTRPPPQGPATLTGEHELEVVLEENEVPQSRIRPVSRESCSSSLASDAEESSDDNVTRRRPCPSRAARLTLTLPTLLSALPGVTAPLFFLGAAHGSGVSLLIDVVLVSFVIVTAYFNAAPSGLSVRLRRFFSWLNTTLILSLFVHKVVNAAHGGNFLAIPSAALMGICLALSIFVNIALLHRVNFGPRTLRNFREELLDQELQDTSNLLEDQ